jgi:cytochrome b subunit of formate dehydrogenase
MLKRKDKKKMIVIMRQGTNTTRTKQEKENCWRIEVRRRPEAEREIVALRSLIVVVVRA